MECVEAALKTGFKKDMAMKFSPQMFLEELSAFNGQNVTSCDDFFVDDLLDFSHEAALLEEEPQQQNDCSASVSLQQEENQSREICNTVNEDFGSVPTSELSVPAEDAAELEWLSHFVEDSFSEYSAPFLTGTEEFAKKWPELGSPVSTQPCFKTPVPAKARSKRTRSGVRVWPLGFRSPSFTDSSSSSTITTSSSSSSPSSSPLLIYTTVTQNLERVCSEARPLENKAKRRAVSDREGGGGAQTPRRCSHCGVQKTPQWRTGPLGAKTLCNACGVRYKSGRLLPEYRPACSPTFSSELHSNHHRKVLEMRRKKEVVGGPETGLAPPPVVPSF